MTMRQASRTSSSALRIRDVDSIYKIAAWCTVCQQAARTGHGMTSKLSTKVTTPICSWTQIESTSEGAVDPLRRCGHTLEAFKGTDTALLAEVAE